MEVEFEYLTEKDLQETYELCVKSFGEEAKIDEIRKVYQRCKDDSHYHFIVGKKDGKVVAYTTMVMFYNLFDGDTPVAALWYVCVDKECQRQGIATKMFRHIEKIARENNCEIIYFTALSDNESAHKFYRSVGYSDKDEKAFVKYLFSESK